MHLKSLLILIILFGQIAVSWAQTDFSFLPQGAYRSIYDFRSLHPFYTHEIIFSRKTYDTTDQAFYIKTYDKVEGLNKKTVKEEIFAVYQNNNLYFNCYRFSMGAGFAKVLNSGRYSYFNGCGYYTEKGTGPAMGIAIMGGVAGVAIVSGTSHFVKTKDFIFDINSGNLHPLDSAYINRILEPHYDLLDEFQQEKDKESFEVLLKYVELLNERSVIEFSE